MCNCSDGTYETFVLKIEIHSFDLSIYTDQRWDGYSFSEFSDSDMDKSSHEEFSVNKNVGSQRFYMGFNFQNLK